MMIRDLISEKDAECNGRVSFSRSLPFIYAALLTIAWLIVGVLDLWFLLDGSEVEVWERVSGWMTWGRDFGFVTVIPYTGKHLGKIGQRREG